MREISLLISLLIAIIFDSKEILQYLEVFFVDNNHFLFSILRHFIIIFINTHFRHLFIYHFTKSSLNRRFLKK